MMKYKTKMRVSENCLHLLDIFTDNYYLELGNIDYEIWMRILNNKTLRIDDVVYFDIQNKGIGASNVDNQNIRNNLPFLNFMNINKKNQSLQLFITYGLLATKSEENKEIFSPIILVPVSLFFENNAILIKIMGRPIENKILLDYLKKKNIDFSSSEKLNDIYSMDKYVLSFFTKYNLNVKLECYLTFANTLQPPTVLNHDMFSLKTQSNISFGSRFYLDDEHEIYNITKLNNRQRSAVIKASNGNSFGISGVIGTGKTTTLINIASDAIYNSKRVLYISNMKETLDYVEEEYSNYGLKSLVTNLTVRSRYNKDKNVYISEGKSIKDIKKELTSNYDIIEEYEKIISERVRDFRFLEVLKNLLNLKNPQVNYEMDNLDDIYKYEYFEIVNSLSKIEDSMKKTTKFKDSKFKSIPIHNNVKYPNQIISLLFQIHKLFTDLYRNKQSLEEKFGFNKIINYARFKNVINNFNSLELSKVPLAWNNSTIFEGAKKNYPNLKTLIYTYQENELFLDWDFQNLESININEFLNSLLDDFFTENDSSKINNIIKNYKDLINKVKAAVYNNRLFNKSILSIKKIFNWDFDETNDEIIENIISLVEYLSTNVYHVSWLARSKKDKLRNELAHLQDNLSKFIILEKQYYKYFYNVNDVDKNIEYLQRMVETNKTPLKFKFVDLNVLISDIQEYKKLRNRIKKLNQRYIDITGFEYSPAYDILVDFDKFYVFLDNIKNEEIERKFVRFLSNTNEDEMEIQLQEFNNFRRSFQIINQIYDYVKSFFPDEIIDNYIKKGEFLVKVHKYLNHIKLINEQMLPIVKNSESFVEFETYLKIKERTNILEKLKREIRENSLYLDYYGTLYEYEKTNINELGIIINSYSAYSELFINQDYIIQSRQKTNYEEITTILNSSLKIIYEINETFKLYSKIFKDGIGSYYYDDFETVINYLDDLIHAKEELKIYLDITENLKILSKFKLFIIINHIINDDYDQLVDDFKYQYFTNLYKIFMDKHLELINTNDLIKIVEDTTVLEELLRLKHVIELSSKKRDIFVSKEYLDLSKPLVLATTPILNTFLNYNDFDLILIDDAHLLNANEYYNAVLGKQVIIAGEEFNHTLNVPNLITRMRNNNIINLNFRYTPTPLKLLCLLNKTSGVFLPRVSENNGIEIISRDIIKYITDLYLNNNNLIINYFTPRFDYKIKINENVSKVLNENNVSEDIIYRIINNQLNVTDLFSGYYYDSDYNIMDISDYYNINTEYLDINNINNLIACKKKVIIIDNNNILRNENTVFVKALAPLLDFKIEPFNLEINDLLLKLGSIFNKNGIIVHGSYHDLSLVLEYNNIYYGILLFSNPDTSHIDILEDYREYYQLYKTNSVKVFIVWITDLMKGFEKVAQDIIKEILS